MATASNREPEIFAAGDTLWFVRFLPSYLPGDGWSLLYVLTDEAGHEVAQVTSTTLGAGHQIQQANFAKAFKLGDYVFSGYVVNQAQDFRHQIYYETLKLVPDLADGAAAGPVKTFYQEMLEAIQKQLIYMASHVLKMTDEQRNHFEMVTRPELMRQLNEFQEKRNNEIQHERARAGRVPTNVVQPWFNIG